MNKIKTAAAAAIIMAALSGRVNAISSEAASLSTSGCGWHSWSHCYATLNNRQSNSYYSFYINASDDEGGLSNYGVKVNCAGSWQTLNWAVSHGYVSTYDPSAAGGEPSKSYCWWLYDSDSGWGCWGNNMTVNFQTVKGADVRGVWVIAGGDNATTVTATRYWDPLTKITCPGNASYTYDGNKKTVSCPSGSSGSCSRTDTGTTSCSCTADSTHTFGGSAGGDTCSYNLTVNKRPLSGTLTVSVNTSGVASWNAITGAANYTVKIGGNVIATTTSTSYNLNSSLLSSAGSKTVTIVANPSGNYSGNVTGGSGVNVYTLTQIDSSGTYITYHISGSTATLRTPAAKRGYTFKEWKKTS